MLCRSPWWMRWGIKRILLVRNGIWDSAFGAVLSFRRGAALDHTSVAMRSQLINFMSGLLLLGVGIYDIIINWELIGVFLG
ncbi:hypothetical protein [Candidatus Villigracilis affinis]|uniref:hypothetical protein n=1 Tax=Candidatus Villigracilis affinis TaxID=3140682 RepID=UPI002A1D6B42|nr:hypothetical protein [Anaerolineales bacterium]